MKLCTAVQEGCGYKDTLRASLLCSVDKILHCVNYLSAAPRTILRHDCFRFTFKISNNKSNTKRMMRFVDEDFLWVTILGGILGGYMMQQQKKKKSNLRDNDNEQDGPKFG